MHESGVSVCALVRKNEGVIINDVYYEPYGNDESDTDKFIKLKRLLKSLVKRKAYLKEGCDIVLPPQYYQLLLVEAPSVPDAERKDAITWRIKDLVSTPVEHLFIEVFDLPKSSRKASKDMVYVVVVDFRDLKGLVDTFNSTSIEINSINIQEMAFRDLLVEVAKADPAMSSVAMVRIAKSVGYIYIISGQDLYLSRQFKVKYSGGLIEEIPEEAIQVEIQRSLDYYERQMAQEPPSKVLIFGENIYEDKIQKLMVSEISTGIKLLNMKSIFNYSDEYDETVLNGLASLGAALRIDKLARI